MINSKQDYLVNSIASVSFLLLSFLVLLENLIKSILGISSLHIDELIFLLFILFSVLYLLFSLSIRREFIYLGAFYLLFFIVSVPGINFNLINVLLQNLIHLKLFIFLITLYYVSKNNLKLLTIIFNSVLIVTILGIVLNLIFQEKFNHWVGFEIVYRNGLLRLAGFQVQPNNIGITLAIFYLYYLFKSDVLITFLRFSTITLIFIIVVFFTGSRTPLLIIPISTVIFLTLHFGRNLQIIAVSVVVALIGTSILFLTDTELYQKTARNITDTIEIEESNYTRGLLLYYSVVIAQENFPIGAGSGSFGTKFSEGSLVYQKYGLTNRHFQEMQGVYESNFASILGEFGLFGIFSYTILLILTYRFLLYKSNNQMNKAYFISIIVSIVVLCLTKPVFMNSYPALLFAYALLIKHFQIEKRTSLVENY